ncbi:MAG: hypothetical protein ACE5GX_02780 [Thermoanaerobaculia bacterium]
MDENPTVAEMNPFIKGKTSNKWKYHALPTQNPNGIAGDKELRDQQETLYERALKTKNYTLKLLRFGQYLHFKEDKWAHWGYTTAWGHFWPSFWGRLRALQGRADVLDPGCADLLDPRLRIPARGIAPDSPQVGGESGQARWTRCRIQLDATVRR